MGQWLKQRRKTLDLTQEGLAEQIGCSYIAIHKIEAGTRRPSRQLAELLADLFKVPAHQREEFISYARGTEGQAKASDRVFGHPSPDNLPALLTRLIGREVLARDIGSHLLQDGARLLTLTGPPGIGKTSLGIHVAAGLRSHFRDGVFFVALAPIVEPAVVPATIVKVLGLLDSGSRTPTETLTETLRDKEMLLLLNNFEQVTEAAPAVVDVLTTCPGVKVIVTSRERLHVRGERVLRVPPLQVPEVPEAASPRSVEAMSRTPAVALFVERAQALVPDFSLNEQNAEAVAAICVRLEGLPLAIELAAARVRILTPQEIQAHLDKSLPDVSRASGAPTPTPSATQTSSGFELLAGGPRDLPARQQTLRSAIDWSYALLSKGERKLFARLGVFRGGCTLSAAEAICNERGDLLFSVLEGLVLLLDKSLMKREEVLGESRYTMLEMIREYAAEQLERSGEASEIRRLHAEYYLLVAGAAASQIDTPEQAVWLSRLESMHDNLRAALQWTQSPAGDPHLGLRLAVALAPFWTVRSHFHEAREWLSRVFSRLEGQKPTALLAGAYARAGRLAFRQSDYAAARRYYCESLAIGEELEDIRSVGIAFAGLGDVATEQGDVVQASQFYEKGLATFRGLDDSLLLADCLVGAGWASMEQGNYELAREQYEEALELCRRQENKEVAGWALSGLGDVAVRKGDYMGAVALLEESLMLRREINYRWGITISLETLGWAVLRQADYTRLYAAAHGLRQSVASAANSLDRWSEHERNIAHERARIDRARWDSAWAAGLALSMEQAVAYALEENEVLEPR